MNRKFFYFSNFFEYSKIIFIQACKCANFQTEWRKWKFFQYNQMKWNIRKRWKFFQNLINWNIAVKEDFPTNQKIFRFTTFSKMVDIFPIKSWFRTFAGDECRINRKIFHFVQFLTNMWVKIPNFFENSF